MEVLQRNPHELSPPGRGRGPAARGGPPTAPEFAGLPGPGARVEVASAPKTRCRCRAASSSARSWGGRARSLLDRDPLDPRRGSDDRRPSRRSRGLPRGGVGRREGGRALGGGRGGRHRPRCLVRRRGRAGARGASAARCAGGFRRCARRIPHHLGERSPRCRRVARRTRRSSELEWSSWSGQAGRRKSRSAVGVAASEPVRTSPRKSPPPRRNRPSPRGRYRRCRCRPCSA